MTEPSPSAPDLATPTFDVEELGLLALRAKAEATRIALTLADGVLERAYNDLSHQLVVLQALEIRAHAFDMPAPAPHDHVDVSETPEAIAAEAEEGEPSEEPSEAEEVVPFRVRPKSSVRWCSICGHKQWKSPSGWSCDGEGHGGVSDVFIPHCCEKPMKPVTDRDDKDRLVKVRCAGCQKTLRFDEIADPGA